MHLFLFVGLFPLSAVSVATVFLEDFLSIYLSTSVADMSITSMLLSTSIGVPPSTCKRSGSICLYIFIYLSINLPLWLLCLSPRCCCRPRGVPPSTCKRSGSICIYIFIYSSIYLSTSVAAVSITSMLLSTSRGVPPSTCKRSGSICIYIFIYLSIYLSTSVAAVSISSMLLSTQRCATVSLLEVRVPVLGST